MSGSQVNKAICGLSKVKKLGGKCVWYWLGPLIIGVEALVGWLLDHPDIQITELSDFETASEESDEEVVEEVEELEAAYPDVSIEQAALYQLLWYFRFDCVLCVFFFFSPFYFSSLLKA